MKATRAKLLIYAALILAFFAARHVLYLRSEKAVLDRSDEFILYSLEPHFNLGDPKIEGLFHRDAILGQTKVTDPALRAQLISALYGFPGFLDGAGENDCFNPRHGIRATSAGRNVDVEICFECGAVYFYENGHSR